MKKLKLKLDGIKEMLSREQMKHISGGYGGGPCSVFANCENEPVSCSSDASDGSCSSIDGEGVACYGDGIINVYTCH